MKTIAISIDQRTLDSLDRLTRRRRGRKFNRSQIVRMALQEFVAKLESVERNERERAIIAKHRNLLARQAEALIADQAKP